MKKFLIPAVAACLLTGCFFDDDDKLDAAAIGSDPMPEEAPRAPIQVEWKQVQESPPTFFPVGVEEDARTTAVDGEWIIGASGANYYVPFSGAGPATYQEVLSSVPESPHVQDDGLDITSKVGDLAKKADPRKLWPFGKEG